MGVYAHYTMVTLSGTKLKCVMGCHPEMMRASLKAFTELSALEADIKELYELFPPGPNGAWVATSDNGDFFALPEISNVFDAEWLNKNAMNIYNSSNEKLPNLHMYMPFLEHMNVSVSSLSHYKSWKTVTTALLKRNNIPLTLEKPLKTATKIATKVAPKKSAITKKNRLAQVVQIAQPVHPNCYVPPEYCVVAKIM